MNILKMTSEEKLKREYKLECEEKVRARTRSAVVRSQIVNAYKILENINFKFVGDTAFVDKVYKAKKNLEVALDDFLMSDYYWEKRVDEFYNMKLEGYKKTKQKYEEEPNNIEKSSNDV